jgi:hypothetical protein
MRTEAATHISERFLFAGARINQRSLAMLKKTTRQFYAQRNIHPDQAGEQFLKWQQQENEALIFTLYTYADLAIPKSFEIIFRYEHPEQFIEAPFTITQVMFNTWVPFDSISHGHKHVCVLSFHDKPPAWLQELPELMTGVNQIFGFCAKTHYPAIAARLHKEAMLKAQYGADWYEQNIKLNNHD